MSSQLTPTGPRGQAYFTGAQGFRLSAANHTNAVLSLRWQLRHVRLRATGHGRGDLAADELGGSLQRIGSPIWPECIIGAQIHGSLAGRRGCRLYAARHELARVAAVASTKGSFVIVSYIQRFCDTWILSSYDEMASQPVCSLFGAEGAVLRPVACDLAPEAGGKGQGPKPAGATKWRP